jgi:hypothetical protein
MAVCPVFLNTTTGLPITYAMYTSIMVPDSAINGEVLLIL